MMKSKFGRVNAINLAVHVISSQLMAKPTIKIKALGPEMTNY